MADSGDDLLAYRCVCGAKMFIHSVMAGRLVYCSNCAAPVIVPEADGGRAEPLAPPVLESQRLSLELARPRDWKRILPIRTDPENHRYELSFPDTEEGLRKYLRQHRFPRGFRKHRMMVFLANRRSDGELIGLVYLTLEPDSLRGSIGIMIHRPYQGMGFGSEAVAAVVDYAMHTLRLHRLSASCDAKNTACCRLLESVGFRKEGDLQDWIRHAERGWVDCCMYRVLASDRA